MQGRTLADVLEGMRHNSNSARRDGLGIGRVTRRRFLAILPAVAVCPGFGLWRRLDLWTRPSCAPPRGSKQLVYVVDDCQELTVLYRLYLEEAGFEVKTFGDRAEALRAFRSAKTRPVLLITDYDGYPVSAEQFMGECRRTQPELKILMASGYPECCLSFAGVRPNRFLLKPFELDQLVAEVKELTGTAPRERKVFCKDFEGGTWSRCTPQLAAARTIAFAGRV